MNRRLVVPLVAATVALTFGAIVTNAARPDYGRPVLAADLDGSMAQETLEASRLGMRPLRHGVEATHDRAWALDFAVEANQCVALIVGVTGLAALGDFQLEDSFGAPLARPGYGTAFLHVEQVQWCSRAAANVHATLRLAPNEHDAFVPEVHWALAAGPRGPTLDERALTRNTLIDASFRDAFEHAEAADARAALEAKARAAEESLQLGATERSPPLRVDERSVALLPPERATFLAAERAFMTRDATPAIAPYFAVVPPWLAQPVALPEASGAESPALLRVGDGWERVLVAVDFDALGPPHVALTFARIADASPDAAVTRVAIPSLERTALTETDGLWLDRTCPASGLFVYTIPAAASALHDVRVSELQGARLEPARPPRRRWDGELLPSEERTALAQRCSSPDDSAAPEACLAFARALDRDGASTADADAAYDRACTAGSAQACGQLAERWFALGAPARHDRAVQLEKTACERSDWMSCERRATRLRGAADPTADLPEIRRLYGTACSEGQLSAACANEQLMGQWQLGGP